jgi:hypothetical protein
MIIASRIRESAIATAITAATMPRPPRPSTLMLDILINEGDGASRRRGTNVGGVVL